LFVGRGGFNSPQGVYPAIAGSAGTPPTDVRRKERTRIEVKPAQRWLAFRFMAGFVIRGLVSDRQCGRETACIVVVPETSVVHNSQA